jgi:hypothetical protein
MPNRYFEPRDARRDAVRTACAALNRAVMSLPATEAAEVRARWAELVEVLAIEPARVLRECPFCKHVAMFEASRCINCWSELPVAVAADALVAP